MMYENITYEELKSLPDDQKIEALKELRKQYPSNKSLGERLGVRPMVASNLYARLVEGKKMGGRSKKVAAEPDQLGEQLVSQFENQDEIQAVKQPVIENKTSEIPAAIVGSSEPKVRLRRVKTASFTIILENEMEGAEAQARIEGIAQSLLKEKKYKVDLRIEEK